MGWGGGRGVKEDVSGRKRSTETSMSMLHVPGQDHILAWAILLPFAWRCWSFVFFWFSLLCFFTMAPKSVVERTEKRYSPVAHRRARV